MNRTLTLAALLVIGHSPFVLAQGSLTPPGAPAPTMKTLDQVEPRTPISALPFTISSSGSYFVTGNLTGAAGQHGITINADNVTLDLGGFQLVGPGSGVTTAIRLVNAHVNATIRNGTVRGWLSSGVVAETSAGTEMRVEHLRVFGSGGAGIALGNNGTARGCEVRANTANGISGGTGCKVTECTATGTVTADGINLGDNAVVSDCVCTSNGNDGIQVGAASRVTGCVAASNTMHGFNVGNDSVLADCPATLNGANGFSLGAGCTLTNCSASSNSGIGISGGDTESLHNCVAESNTGIGIAVLQSCSISHCTAEFNTGTAGISTNNACTIIGCTAFLNNSNAATSAGISVSNFCLVSQCVVASTGSTAGTLTSTTGMGIKTAADCTIERCTVQGNKGDGISVTSACLIRDNLCDGNGAGTGDGAGIHTISSGNRIEGNTVTANDRGIDVDSIASLIIRNSASGNTTDYDIAANNRYGAIVFIPGTGTAAVSGNSAASTLTSTDPWANFSF